MDILRALALFAVVVLGIMCYIFLICIYLGTTNKGTYSAKGPPIDLDTVHPPQRASAVMHPGKIDDAHIYNRALTEEEIAFVWAMAGSWDVTTTDNGDDTYSQTFTPKEPHRDE